MNAKTNDRTKIIKSIFCFAAFLVVCSLEWKMATASEDDNFGKFQLLLLKMWSDVWGNLMAHTTMLSFILTQALSWTTQQLIRSTAIVLTSMESTWSSMQSTWHHLLFLTTRASSWMSRQLLFVKIQTPVVLGSMWFQVMIFKAIATTWTSHTFLVIKAVVQYTAQYIWAVAHVLLGVHNPELVNIYTLPLRIVTSIVLTGTSISTDASFLTTVASAIFPFVLTHDIGLMTNLEQVFIKHLLVFSAITAVPIYVAHHRYSFPIVVTQMAYYFVKGTVGCFSVQDPLHYYVGLIMWLVMTADAAWLIKIFLIPLASDDDLSPREKKNLALEVAKHVSVWAVIWNLPSFGLELLDFKNY
jgi:hypothetical protein